MVFGGVPALTVAYLNEEVRPRAVTSLGEQWDAFRDDLGLGLRDPVHPSSACVGALYSGA